MMCCDLMHYQDDVRATVSAAEVLTMVQRLHARTTPGFMLKLLSSLTALTFAHVL
jgi:hypothetical protein